MSSTRKHSDASRTTRKILAPDSVRWNRGGGPGKASGKRQRGARRACGALGNGHRESASSARVSAVCASSTRNFVEPSNLQRQSLFEESDARDSLPKAIAAGRRLGAINSSVQVEGVIADLTSQNAQELLSNFPLILDGTDNP